MQLVLPQSIDSGTPVVAAEHAQNYAAIRDHVNTHLLNRDGSVAATSPISGVDPTIDAHLATKNYVDDKVATVVTATVGDIKMGGWLVAPTGWLFCRGQAVSRTTYAALFAVIGTAFGVGDGATTFNLPDMRARSPIGFNDNVMLDSDPLKNIWNSNFGEKFGTPVPSAGPHTHVMTHQHTGSTSNGGAHDHNLAVRRSAGGLGTDEPARSNGGGTLENATTAIQGDHTHPFTTDFYVGSTSSGSFGDTATGNYHPGQSVNFAIYAGV